MAEDKLRIPGTFIPVKNIWGKDHKENGVYLNKGEIRFYKCDGYQNRTCAFKISDIASIKQVSKFRFLFLILFYNVQFVNAIVFNDKEGQAIATLPIRTMTDPNARKLLQEIMSVNSKIELDPQIKAFIDTGSSKVLMKQFYKAMLKGMIPTGIVILVLILILFAANL